MAQSAITSRGIADIQARWRVPLTLVPDDPADPSGQWHGPCPRCKAPRKLSVHPGDIQPGHLVDSLPVRPRAGPHDPQSHVPGAPPPGQGKAKGPDAAALEAELAALKDTVRRLVLNPRLKGKPKDLAVLLALGDSAPAALDALEVTDKGNRSRYQTEVRRALASSPGKVVRYDNRRRSRAPKGKKGLSPAEVVTSDNHPVVTSDNRYSYESDAATSGNTDLTGRATLVLPLGATDTLTRTRTQRP